MADEVDNGCDRRVAALAAEEWGVLSLEELRRCGLSRDAVGLRARKGRLHRVHRGVYAVGHANVSDEGRFLAAVKACGPGAVLSHFAAAALWGFVRWDSRFPEVTVKGTGARRHEGIRVHRTTRLDRRDVRRHKGIPVTAPARTLVDLATVIGPKPLRRAVREAQSQRWVSTRQVVDMMRRLGPRPGVRNLANILVTGPAPTRSELEDEVLDLILSGGSRTPT
jgi:predicted transcriptional regulator of viral defense system